MYLQKNVDYLRKILFMKTLVRHQHEFSIEICNFMFVVFQKAEAIWIENCQSSTSGVLMSKGVHSN